jgi:CubicO group peptidase (beta-lactamase class C family)
MMPSDRTRPRAATFGCALLLAILAAGLRSAHALEAVSAPRLDGIEAVVREEIAAGRLAGAVVVVGQAGRVVYERAFGERAREPVSLPMTLDTIFDLASLTKVVATTTAVMQLVERGLLDLDAPVARYWPAFAAGGKATITLRALLTHRSGLRADLDERARWSGHESALDEIVAEPPIAAPGSRFIYSDVNFAVLGEIVQRVSEQTLDVYCAARIFGPLGMRDTGFLPSPERHDRIAPTSREGDLLLWGVVHDPTARRMGGVAGHAGLFATARDLAIFAQTMLDGGTRGTARILEPRSIAVMTAPQPPFGARPRRGLGWDLDAPGVPDWGALFSDRAYGHTGYTGTSLWIDPATSSYVVLLTNRVHPDDTGDVRQLRTRLASLVAPVLASGMHATDAPIASTACRRWLRRARWATRRADHEPLRPRRRRTIHDRAPPRRPRRDGRGGICAGARRRCARRARASLAMGPDAAPSGPQPLR